MDHLAAVVTVAIATTASGCGHVEPLSNAYAPFSAAVGDRCAEAAADGQCSLYDVSLIELISSPEKFHDKKVRVLGFVSLAFEGNMMCPTRDTVNRQDCIFLDIDGLADPGFRKGYVVLEGRFDGELRGHLGCCSGTIDHISRMKPWR